MIIRLAVFQISHMELLKRYILPQSMFVLETQEHFVMYKLRFHLFIPIKQK